MFRPNRLCFAPTNLVGPGMNRANNHTLLDKAVSVRTSLGLLVRVRSRNDPHSKVRVLRTRP